MVDSSGPIAPRFAHTTTIVIEAGDTEVTVRRDHRDAAGPVRETRTLTRAAFDALVAVIGNVVTLGGVVDLVGDKRHNVGVAFNHVVLVVSDQLTRVDYLPSHLDDENGDARVRAIVAAIKKL